MGFGVATYMGLGTGRTTKALLGTRLLCSIMTALNLFVMGLSINQSQSPITNNASLARDRATLTLGGFPTKSGLPYDLTRG